MTRVVYCNAEKKGNSACEVDGQRLAKDIDAQVRRLDDEGFRVVAVTPVISGDYSYEHDETASGDCCSGWGYGYGFSFTEGVVIVAEACDDD